MIELKKPRLSCLLLLIVIVSCVSEKQFPVFTIHQIDTIGTHLGQTDLADLDNDGDLDWIVGEAPWGNNNRLWWWEYESADVWKRHFMGKANSDVGGACYDVDSDGWIDFWGGSKLYLNNQDGSFSGYDVETIFSHDNQLGDVDGDSRIDGISNSDQYGLVWYTIPANPSLPWKEHLIQPASNHKIHAGAAPKSLADIDGDGDNDVVTGRAWYENKDGAGNEWEAHENIDLGEEHKYGIGLKTWTVDLDGDGDIDIIQSEADNPDSRVAWFENDGKGRWTRHIIKDKGEKQDFHSLVVADFDKDGDLDVCSGGGPLSDKVYRIFIWENTAGKSKSPRADKWKEHLIGEVPCHEAVGGDVDGDGDIDICTKPWTTGNAHYFFENKLN